jgi:hypothetical protein
MVGSSVEVSYLKGSQMTWWFKCNSVSMVKTDRLEGDSSGVDSKKSCNSLGHLDWVNVQRAWGDLLGQVLWWT